MSNKTLHELFSFKGQSIIVTGGAKGIGSGIARRFAESGANVLIADLDENVGVQTAAALSKEFNSTVLFSKTDVSNELDVLAMIQKAVDSFGTLDVLVNDAGVFPNKPVLEMDLAFWEKTQAVNSRSVFLASREAAKVMVRKGRGNIINIASIDALHPSMIGLAAYDASKHAVWGFTKNFALEVASRGIRVNAIAPGGIATEGVAEMNKGAGDMTEAIKRFTEKIPLRRFGVPDDIATVVLFLASDASSYMTGELVVVDGGYLLA